MWKFPYKLYINLLFERIFDIKVIPLSKNPCPLIMNLSGSQRIIFLLIRVWHIHQLQKSMWSWQLKFSYVLGRHKIIAKEESWRQISIRMLTSDVVDFCSCWITIFIGFTAKIFGHNSNRLKIFQLPVCMVATEFK